jgi:hypothetical protein
MDNSSSDDEEMCDPKPNYKKLETDFKIMQVRLRLYFLAYIVTVGVIFILMQVFWVALPIQLGNIQEMGFREFCGQVFRLMLVLVGLGGGVFMVLSTGIYIKTHPML